MNKTQKEEFYTKFTDGVDKENNYYDCQFENARPQEVEAFIDEIVRSISKEYADGAEKLSCLEAAGVDNWQGYDSAMEMMG